MNNIGFIPIPGDTLKPNRYQILLGRVVFPAGSAVLRFLGLESVPSLSLEQYQRVAEVYNVFVWNVKAVIKENKYKDCEFVFFDESDKLHEFYLGYVVGRRLLKEGACRLQR